MATGDPIAVVNSKITALNDSQILTLTAADQTTDATAQVFTYTPTGKDNKLCIVFQTSSANIVTVTIAAGVGVFGAAAKALTIPAVAGTYIVQIETGKYMQANGTISLSCLPTTVDLVNELAFKVGCIELQ